MRHIASVAAATIIGVTLSTHSSGELPAMNQDESPPVESSTNDKTTATVDAIEAGIARLLVGVHPAKTMTVDASALPEGAREGSALQIEGPLTAGLREARLTLDPEAAQQRQNRVRHKLERLRKGDDQGPE